MTNAREKTVELTTTTLADILKRARRPVVHSLHER